MAGFNRNQWQPSIGISGNLRLESVAGFDRNQWQPSTGIRTPEEAFAFAQQFELHYTPQKGSWLNMADIEFSALSIQCLDRRIADQETLAHEVRAWTHKRNQARTTVHWKFTTSH